MPRSVSEPGQRLLDGAAWGQLGALFSGTLEPIAAGDGTTGTGFLYSVLDYYPEGPKLMVNGTFDGMSSAAAVAHWGDRIFLLTAVPLGVSDDEVHQYRGALPERDVHQYLAHLYQDCRSFCGFRRFSGSGIPATY